MSEVLILIWLHFIADFMLQTDQMAINKSKSLKWLGIHIGAYTLPFLFYGVAFALINAAAHFITDLVTSKITARLWERQQRHWFFVVIGLDQAIHLTTLIVSFHYLFGGIS